MHIETIPELVEELGEICVISFLIMLKTLTATNPSTSSGTVAQNELNIYYSTTKK